MPLQPQLQLHQGVLKLQQRQARSTARIQLLILPTIILRLAAAHTNAPRYARSSSLRMLLFVRL